MKTAIVMLILSLVALIVGCGETPSVDSRNIAAILSPDGSRIAFARIFRYYLNKASVFDPGGWEEDVFAESSIYVIDRSTEELTKVRKFSEFGYYCSNDYCPVNISWEGGFIAYSDYNAIYIIDPDGRDIGTVDVSREKYGPSIPFTLSGDARKLFYIGRHPLEYDRDGLYSVNLDGTGKSYVADLIDVRYYDVYDMMWDSTENCILMIERTYDVREPVVWRITPDGSWLKPSENGLSEYRQRRLGGWESVPPFSELEKLMSGISYAEWGVPAPDEFD